MRVLIIKTSSLGDVVHTLPALTDARAANPDISFDWIVEEAFVPIPSWHNAVNEVIPVALRRWRKSLFSKQTRQQWFEFRHKINTTDYDLIIDAQGLIKSAWLTRMATGTSHGLNRRSAREGLVSFSYDVVHPVDRGQHAIKRLRELFAKALNYPLPESPPDYGIYTGGGGSPPRQLVFLHGTTWQSKHWPERYWQELLEFTTKDNYQVQLPWGNDEERARAERLAQNNDRVQVSPSMDLNGLVSLLSSSMGAVAVDTGLGHLAAALSLPTVSIYGSTDPSLTGTCGNYQGQLTVEFECAPCLKRQCQFTGDSAVSPACYQTLQAPQVWHKLQQLINEKETVND
ncbi:MAG: lipopolysaccharide heptosyltransferase I [Gammaproteobacteria bacterium]|nr:lipopolysaccharide heptosyltransferase I [Gammaproteobacteria bacterium]